MPSFDDASGKGKAREVAPGFGDYPEGSATPSWLVPVSYVGLTLAAGGLCRTPLIQATVVSIFRFGLRCTGWKVVQGGQEEAKNLLVFASAFNALVTYVLSPTLSVWGQTMCGGYQNRAPRSGRPKLYGIGQRMVSTHYNMMEVFPLFALGAGTILAVAPPTSTLDPLLTSVLLHVYLKAVVYPTAYVFDFPGARGISHAIGVGAIVSALFSLVGRI